jgi:hypothetical protein
VSSRPAMMIAKVVILRLAPAPLADSVISFIPAPPAKVAGLDNLHAMTSLSMAARR